VNGQGHNIPLVTNTGSRLYKKAFYKSQSCTRLWKLPTFNVAGNPHGRWPATAKFWQSQWDFHQPLGFKNTILRGSRGKPGEWSRPEYSSGDQYRIRFVQERFLQISILHAFVKITHLQRSRQPSLEKAWYYQILMKSKGVFINLWDSKVPF